LISSVQKVQGHSGEAFREFEGSVEPNQTLYVNTACERAQQIIG